MNARIDFHIHSCLSPCAALEMSPRAIIAGAKEKGLDCIALADHGCVENLPAFHDACAEAGLPCLYGLEATSSEEVHTLCLFDQLDPALKFGRMIYDSIMDYPNDPERFGMQPIVTVDDDVLNFADKLLFAATDISFFDLVPMALDAGALCIPSHIDREYLGAIAQIGFLPDLPYDAVEVVSPNPPAGAEKWPIVHFSDAHHPDQIGRRFTEVETEAFTVPALRAAFHKLLPA
ncbi:PHP domain-containing protein [Tichowtungia aerotolerans]|uniref:PHP domain-containing protein n=1 Tax=Tichowtungia aerotolerans TaxID=2697043 RepID=A0A6P1MAT2_9BACT|nr:PHP domain-containing protein [Tichowtungia aerotolerans]QHI70213.1 PHP domain-containing protein [Tichowtungia aerotolerans]